MYNDLFKQSGLSQNEAIIYEYLLKNGESAALDITKNTPLKKGVIYIALSELTKKGLIIEKMLTPKNLNVRNKKKIAYFSPEHPEKLRAYLNNQKSAIKKAQKNFEANINDIISNFNLVSGKPGINFFEGISGVKKVIMDSLTSSEELYTYANAETVMKYIPDINKEYVKKRNKLNITKKMILPNSDFSKKFLKNYHRKVTDIKFIDHKKFPFTSLMQIYDNKITYLNFSEKHKIGIIIEDKTIYQMHRNLFEFIWENADDVK